MTNKLRIAGRIGWFIVALAIIVSNYFFTVAFVPKKSKRLARAAWLQRASRRHLKILAFTADINGPIPKSGLLVSNHLSYLDIMAIAAITPAVFVSKSEVRRWPVFGWCAALAGTIFVERERRLNVDEVNREIKDALDDGALVVIFPEGTSSNGDTLLPFHSSLLEPVVGGAHEISTGCLRYSLADGSARDEVCYWGDHAFFPHLMNLLGKKSIHATVRFGKFQKDTDDRKELAQRLHTAVLKLRENPGRF